MVMKVNRLIWEGYYYGDTGYTTATRKYFFCSRLPKGILPMHGTRKNIIYKGMNMSKYIVPPDKIQSNDLVITHQVPTHPRKVYFCTTEFDIPPEHWWENLENARMILTQSKFCKKIFSKIHGLDSRKIKIVHYPIDLKPIENKWELPEPPTGIGGGLFEDYMDKRKKHFTFGSIFDWCNRKKPELMWKAFTESFPIEKYPKMRFLNRISSIDPLMKFKFNTINKDDPRIKLVPHVKNIRDFYSSIDCYCQPSAGEGFGQTLAEAMYLGIPTIASEYGGNREFMNHDNSWLCSTDGWEYIKGDIVYSRDIKPYMRYKIPKIESIKEQMLDVFNSYISHEFIEKCNKGKESIKSICSYQKILDEINEAVKWYEQKY